MAIKNVAVAGATGNVGTSITTALLASGEFNITALIRSGSAAKAKLPSNVKVLTIDYADPDTLVDALRGQDAVISALNHGFLNNQRALLDASVSAGVARFIPAEYGSDSLNPQSSLLPLFASKKAEQKRLEELAAEGKITYTIVINGPLLDFGLAYGFLGPDLKKRQMSYVDDGNAKFSTTTLASVGKIVVGVLRKPEGTRNRAVYVQEAAITQRDLLGLCKHVLGDDGWVEVDKGTTEQIEKASYEELAKGKKDAAVFAGFLMSAVFRKGYGGHFQKLDNELLGIAELKGSDIVELIEKAAKGPTA